MLSRRNARLFIQALKPSLVIPQRRQLLQCMSVASASSLSFSLSAPSPLLASMRSTSSTPDGHSGASIVIVDPIRAAEERDRLARSQLDDEETHRQAVFVLKGLEHTIPYTLKVLAPSSELEELKPIAKAILQEAFDLVDRTMNSFNPESEVSCLNQLEPGTRHKASEVLWTVLSCARDVSRVTGGSFDPGCGPVLEYLRQNAGEPLTPQIEEQIERLSSFSSMDKCYEFDDDAKVIIPNHQDSRIDLGSISKGFTVDHVIESLNAAGMKNAFFEWGGDCRGSGHNARGEGWAVGISRPPPLEEIGQEGAAAKQPMLRVVNLHDEALATSGDYENMIRGKDGKLYNTIFDWKTNRLLTPNNTDVAQVSVKSYSCMHADALATACMVKRDFVKIRYTMENMRYNRRAVTDYTAFIRDGERLAHMYEIATESAESRQQRIAGCIPARVVVIGGGLAGQSAAIEAARCGAQVILVEKDPKMGGNSAKATSGINAWGSREQMQAGVSDAGKFFERDTHLSGVGGSTKPSLVKMLSVKSASAIAFLTGLGVPLSVLSQLGGHSHKRTHRAPDTKDGTPVPIGYTIMQKLEHHIRSSLSRQVSVLTETSVEELLYTKTPIPDGNEDVRINGVRIRRSDGEDMTLNCDAVILATGGFSNDQSSDSLLKRYAPQLFGRPTTNGAFATGDGVKMAEKLGAHLVDMDKIQLHPTGLIDPKDPSNKTKYLGPEALRGSGGILINSRGERFVNELDLRSVVSAAINAQKDEYPESDGSMFAYCVLNDAAVKLFGVNSHAFYWKTLGLFTKYDTIEEFAAVIGCTPDTLRQTLETYEKTSRDGRICPLTGKAVFPCVIGPQGPFHVACITPSIHYTMGGCLISAAAEVLQSRNASANSFEERRPIQGLFGAGEVTGGVHGRNRLGGNSLLECVVFGRIAGDRAGTILQKQQHGLSFTNWTNAILRDVREGGLFGQGCRMLRFNLPGSLQTTGLKVGQFIAIRGDWDGEKLQGFYSPISLPDYPGSISILVRADKGVLSEWISNMRPGDALELKACGGISVDRIPERKEIAFKGRQIRKLALIAGGSGIAPIIQLIIAAMEKPYIDNIQSIRVIYAAENYAELTFRSHMMDYEKIQKDKEKFGVRYVLNNPPESWIGGVGYVDQTSIARGIQPPSEDLLVAICGPPAMQRAVKQTLIRMGYNSSLVRTVDQDNESP